MRIKKKALIWLTVIVLFTITVIEITIGFSDEPMIVLYRIIVGFILAYCLYKGVNIREIYNPFIFFALTPLSLMLYTESVSTTYLNKLKPLTWVLAIVNMIAFLAMLSYTSRPKKYERLNETIDTCNENISSLMNRRLIFHAVVLFSLGFFPLLYQIVFGHAFFLASVFTFFTFPGLAMAWRSKNKYLISILYLIVALSFMINFNKSIFLSYGLITLICYKRYFIFNKKQFWKMLAISVFGVLAFFFIAFPLKSMVQDQGLLSLDSLITEIIRYSTSKDDYYAKTIVFNGPAVFRFPYMYLVSAWNNVQYIMETQSFHTYGLWFFKPLLSWLQIDGLLGNTFELKPYSSFNTFTYITVLYKDFGLWGSWIESVFLGYYVGHFFNKYRCSMSAFDIACYAIISQAVIEMFFSNHFFQLSYPFTIVVICWLYKLVFKSSRAL